MSVTQHKSKHQEPLHTPEVAVLYEMSAFDITEQKQITKKWYDFSYEDN